MIVTNADDGNGAIRSGNVQVITPAVSEHVPDDPAALNVLPDGTVSVTVTPVESDGPLLVTVIV